MTAMAPVIVLVAVWVALIVSARVTVARMRPDPWRVPEFREWFAGWVASSVADHRGPAPVVGELESAVAVLTRPVAPPSRRLRVA